jgi:hypothetical protein
LGVEFTHHVSECLVDLADTVVVWKLVDEL